MKEEKTTYLSASFAQGKEGVVFVSKKKELSGRLPFTFVSADNTINVVISTLESHIWLIKIVEWKEEEHSLPTTDLGDCHAIPWLLKA